MDQRRAAAALLALAACIACSAAAPTANSNHTALELHNGPVEGCYYNFQHYGEGDRIMTNEPCLNCTCHNRMLMCYLRVCPFTKAIGQDCTVEKRADQCCPIVTCPDVPVDLLTSTSTSSPAEYGTTGLGKLDKYGCSIHGKYFPEGSKVPPTPNKPCEHCYCIRNMTTCVMQECTLHVDGCTPIYHKDVCCPVRYSCDHPEDEIPLLDDMTTTVRPTPGFLLTTTTILPVTQMSQDCVHDDQIFPDGALIKTEKACEHCYCMKGDIVCVVQECGTPMENEGKNCTSLPPRQGQCCPDTYICEGDERITESTTETEELTTSPPRRAGVEGSGYRNEPDELYTEMTPVLTETEGSGDLFTTIPEIDTVENITPQKVSPEIVDETLLTTTETSLQFSQSTEPDKGQNTIPDSISDKETTHIPVQDKITLPGLDKINDFDHTISGDQSSRKDDIITTEKGGDTVHDESSTPKQYEKVTTDSTDFLGKTTVMSEDITQTSKSEVIETIEQDQKTTMPTTDTQKSQESLQPEIITDTVTQSSVTEGHKLDDEFRTTTEPQISNDLTTTPEIKIVGIESTSVNPTVNEIDDHITPISSPSRIPGEGDCLLNGITYTNNTSVPNTNNCHTGCKCISSIIKCDPIICSPPPEYMENVNDCQPVYDTPDSCCPTYVCSVKETVPPESHSQMSGTESPKPVEASECSGSDCVVGEDKKTVAEPTTICTSGDCLDKTPETHQECTSNDCQDHKQTKPVDCSGGQCEMLPVLPCEGENCKIEPTKEIIPEKDLDTNTQGLPTEDNIVGQEDCAGDNCVKKEYSEIGDKSDCSTSDCKLHDEPTMAPVDKQTIEINTEKVFVEKSTLSTVTDMNAPKTESIESLEHLTTSKLNEEESDKDVTKQLETYTESSEKLTTIHEENITDTPKDHDTEIDSNQTDSPIIQTPTELSQEAEILPTEKPKPSDKDASSENEFIKTVTPSLQETYTMTTAIDVAQTEPETHFETKTETSLIEENEEFTTKKPHVFDSNVHETVSDEIYTTAPQVMSSEAPTKHEGPVTTENEGFTTKKPFDFDSDVQQTISDEIHTKTPSAATDAPESLVTEKKETSEVVTEKEDTATQPSEILVTKKEEEGIIYDTPEIVTEKKEIETIAPEIFTEKEEIVTQSPTMIIDEEKIVTEIPEKIVTEKEEDKLTSESPKIIPEEEEAKTMAPEVLVTTKKEQKDEMQSESPEVVTEKVEIDTELPEILYTTQGTIYSEATEQLYTAMEGAQTSISDITASEKKTTQSEVLELATEKVVMESNIPDIIATVVTEKEDIVTKVPDEIYVEKEDIPTKTSEVTASETDSVQTEIPDIFKEERISTIASDVLNPEKQTAFIENTGTTEKIIKLETLVPVTEAEVIQTEAPILIDYESERIKTMSPEMVTEKENVQTDSPDIKLEETTKLESDKTLVEEQTKTSISSGIDESAYVTEESLIKHPVTLPEVSTEEKVYDDKGTKPENTITEDITLSGYTEPSEIYTPHETVTYKTVTDHLTVEDKTETSTKESQLLITEELEQITKLPQDFVTKLEDDAPTTTYDLHYTSSSDKLGTKSDDIPHGVDHSVTESQATTEQEKLASQDAETSTEYGSTFTHEYIESSGVDKESSSLPTNNVKEKEDKYTEYPEMYSTISQISDKSTKQPESYVSPTGEIATTEKFTEIQQTSTMTDSEKQFDDEEHRKVTDEIQQTTVGNVIELTTTGKVITEKEVISTDSPQQQTLIDHKQDSDYPLLPTTLQDSDKKLETATDTADFVTEVTKTQSVYDIEKEQELTTNIPDKDLTIETIYTDKETTQSPYKLSESTGQQQAVSQQSSKVGEDTTEYNVETTTKLRDEKEDEKEERVPEIITQKDNEETQEKETTTIPQTTQSSNINKLESTPTFTVTSETEVVTEKDTDGLKYTVKDEEQDKPSDIEKEVFKPSNADDKSSETTDGTGLQEAYSPDHIAFDKSTTQLPTQISEEISTVKVIPSLDDTNLNAEHEINTKVPDSIATFEQSTSHIKDNEITTESYTYNTISEDKDTVSTSIGEEKEIQKEYTSDSDKYLTTSSSFQPQDYTRITEQPLSLVTNIDYAEPSHTTVSQKEPVTELESIPDEHKMEEEKKQTILPDIYVTESQKLSTEAPKEHGTVQEQGSESSSEINEEDSNTIVTHSAHTLIDENYLTDHKTTAISIEQTDTSLDGTTISNIELQKTEGTPSSVIEEGLTYQQKTTTVSSTITETQPSHSHEQEIPPEKAIDELATKLPYEGSTIFDEITNMPTTSEIDHEKEINTTDAAFVEEQVVTLYPEVHDQQTIIPEKETSESQGLEDSKTSKPLTEKELISTPMPIETDISVNLITDVTTQPDKETTTFVEVVTEKEVIFAENKPLSETTGTEEPQEKESITESSDRLTTIPGTLSSTSDLPKDDEHQDDDILSQGTTHKPELSTLLIEDQTDSTDIEKITAIEEIQKPTEKAEENQPEIYSTQPVIEKETFTTESAGHLNLETEKIGTSSGVNTELPPTTLASSNVDVQFTQAHKEFDSSEETKLTTEQQSDFSETTPFLVELEHHTHQVIEESSRAPVEEFITPVYNEPQQTERGDQNLEVTSKYEDEYITSVPVKETDSEYEDKEKHLNHTQDQIGQKVPSATTITVKDITEILSNTEIIPTVSSTYSDTDGHELEKQTTIDKNTILSTSAPLPTIREQESETSTSRDIPKSTYPIVEPSSISTEKDIYSGTEEPMKSETIASDEGLVQETSKATTSKIIEETSTLSSPIEKSPQPEEKPIVTTVSPIQEVSKPGFDDEINEGVPHPDFPPSGGYGQEPDYIEEDQAFGPGTCRYGGKVYVSAQQIPRDDPCDFCFCFRSDIICLQQSCPPPIHGCHEEPIQGFCCPRYECPVSMATTVNVTTTTTTTTTTLPPHFFPHAYKGAAQRRGCQIKGHSYKVGEVVRASSGPCLHCTCGGDGQMKCDPKACTPEPMLRQMIAAAVSAKRRR